MDKDALKFFHAYINEMIEVGGENLPRAVSTKLGAKLGELYKIRGFNTDIENALKRSYKVLGATPMVKKIDESTYEVSIKHAKKFCPIGGKTNPSQTKVIQDNICYPYTKSFLMKMFPQYEFHANINRCILADNGRICNYTLKISNKNNSH
jgi:hypothetical protein